MGGRQPVAHAHELAARGAPTGAAPDMVMKVREQGTRNSRKLTMSTVRKSPARPRPKPTMLLVDRYRCRAVPPPEFRPAELAHFGVV